jgi:serine protease Do
MAFSLPPQSESPRDAHTPHRSGSVKTRAALLGTVAVLAVGAYAVNFEALRLSFTAPAHADAQAPLQSPAGFADIVDRVKGTVVSIKVKVIETASAKDQEMPKIPPELQPFLKKFGEEGGGGTPFQFHNSKPHEEQAQGSGFIISADGYVVTNDHVVDNSTSISVVTDEGKILPAKIIGTDKKTDLALLKITTPGTYPYVDFSAKQPRIGDWVLAVGNPFGLGGTFTAGIVSARGRDIGAGPYDEYLQIDAPINRGNSGGPDFDMQGHVVGVNTAIYSPSGGSVGIGFAIPVDVVQNVVSALKDHGKVTRGWIGVQIQPVTTDIADSLGLKSTKGALVAEVQPNGPAKAAGVKSGDIILDVNGQSVDGPRELARKIAALGPNAKVDLRLWRSGSEQTLAMTLGTLPNEQVASAEQTPDTTANPLSSFGLVLAPATEVPGAGKQGVVVTEIDPDGSAAQKGLKVGDVILEAGGKPVSQPSEISSIIGEAKKDGRKAVLLRVKNGDDTHYVALAVKPAS